MFKATVNSIRKTWHGEEKLWKVFWLYPFIVIFSYIMLLSIFALGVCIAGHSPKVLLSEHYLRTQINSVLIAPGAFWLLFSVYRCMNNTKSKILSYVALGAMLLPFYGYLKDLLNAIKYLF